ncbi:hypothetical protein [Maritimibacter dapengensis]|uniref:Uncharacterized protein n=1 Tax=Maritimibacter dapengensis TaxID=2836868 RepID=A0ABS6SY68_9RHOB|nr:hypothetical protein [Maritimibacter dapengensis]MBV7377905.1 hypothetical protein [Maritimibacter dapengensis]
MSVSSPVIIDLTDLRENTPSVSEIRRIAIHRTALQDGAASGPIACICRDIKDLTAFRFYCVMTHLTGLRQERDACAGLSTVGTLTCLATKLGLDNMGRVALIAEIQAYQQMDPMPFLTPQRP